MISNMTNAKSTFLDIVLYRRLVLQFSSAGRIGIYGKAYLSTEQQATGKDSWLSRENGNKEWPACAEAPPSERPNTTDPGSLLNRLSSWLTICEGEMIFLKSIAKADDTKARS